MANHRMLFFRLTALFTVAILLSAFHWVVPNWYARLWPPFHMTYSVWQADSYGSLDQTHELVVRSEADWRDTVVQDVNWPPNIGNTRQFYRPQSLFPLFRKPGAILVIREELQPNIMPRIRLNIPPFHDFHPAEPSEPGRLVFERAYEYVVEVRNGEPVIAFREDRIEIDAASLEGCYLGGIPVYSETRVNGELVRVFRAESLTIYRN